MVDRPRENPEDADGSGSLTMTELVSAAQDASIKGSDAEMIAALMENYSKLDKLGDEDDGVSCADIEAYMGAREWAILETTEGPLSLTLSLANCMEKKFADLDKDKDGRVQTRQIAEYIDTLDKDSKEHMLLQNFMDNLDEILRADLIPGLGPPYRITKDAVGAWAKKELDGCEDFALVRSVEDAIVRAREGMKSATEGINRELFAHKSDPARPRRQACAFSLARQSTTTSGLRTSRCTKSSPPPRKTGAWRQPGLPSRPDSRSGWQTASMTNPGSFAGTSTAFSTTTRTGR